MVEPALRLMDYLRCLLLLLVPSINTEAIQVIGGSVKLVEGATAILPCKLIGSDQILSQISWQRTTREKSELHFFYTISDKNGPRFVNGQEDRISFIGDLNERNGSLQITNVSLKDEGDYICTFTMFPSDHGSTQIPLEILVPPITSIQYNLPIVGEKEVLLATCLAVASKPQSEVRWLFGDLGEHLRETSNFTTHANGTTTTETSLFVVPTKELNGRQVQCVVSCAALTEEKKKSFTIQVYFSPKQVTVNQAAENTLKCVSEANPEPSITWTRLNHLDFRVEGTLLQLPNETSVSGFYQCEASNSYGQSCQLVYVHTVKVSSRCYISGWTSFGILLFLNIALFFYKARNVKRCTGGNPDEMQPVQTSGSPDRQRPPDSETVSL